MTPAKIDKALFIDSISDKEALRQALMEAYAAIIRRQLARQEAERKAAS